MRLLGIDYGKRKIGLAFGDTETKIAVPLEVIWKQGDEAIRDIVSILKKEDMEGIVIGIPSAVGNHPNEKQIAIVRAFVDKLKKFTDLPIEEEDESFTTAESRRLMNEEGAEAEEDALAAMIILQSYLNRTSL
jgi:putative Holliday junction resolvase